MMIDLRINPVRSKPLEAIAFDVHRRTSVGVNFAQEWRKKMLKNFRFKFLQRIPFLLALIICLIYITLGQVNPAFAEEKQNPLDELITLDYKEADLSSVLRSLSYTYNLNLVGTKDVRGKVTIVLKDVKLQEALNAILAVNGYTYTQKNNLIYIIPGPELKDIGTTSCFIKLKYLTPSEAEGLLRRVISTRGDIRMNEATNSLIITDFPTNVEQVKELLEKIDIPPVQVLIEAKLVEVTSKDLQNIGITWSTDYSPGHGLFGISTEYGEQLKNTMSLAGPSSSLSGNQIKIDTLALKGITIEATIDALIQKQKAHLLASPSIATLNNKEARIVIGEKVPYKEKTQTTTGTTETTKFVDVGTTLKVTPQVSPDGYITMAIHPEVSSVLALLDAGPRITTREADCVVRVADGQTIIIGGLTKKQTAHVKSHVPFLGRIPIIGFLFSSRSSDLDQTELVIFITPRIVPDKEKISKVSRKEIYVDIRNILEQRQEEIAARQKEKKQHKLIRKSHKEQKRANSEKRLREEKKQSKEAELEDLFYKTESECLYILNEEPENKDVFDNLVQLYILEDKYFREGENLYNKDSWEEAISKWQKVLVIEPNNEKAINLIEKTRVRKELHK